MEIAKILEEIQLDLGLQMPTTIETVNIDWKTNENRFTLFVKRDDLIHPVISGNKWRKLKWNIAQILERKINTVVSFGGAYSNHLYALSAVCKYLSLRLIIFVRGEELNVRSNSTLLYLHSQGAEIHFIRRPAYRNKEEDEYVASVLDKIGEFYLIPEGGSNYPALRGVGEIIDEIVNPAMYQYIAVAAGTGTTAAGLLHKMKEKGIAAKLIVFNALKADFMRENIGKLIKLTDNSDIDIINDFHFGGFGKTTNELVQFKSEFENKSSVSIDLVYNAKLLYGLKKLSEENYFPPNSKILWIHTGGLR